MESKLPSDEKLTIETDRLMLEPVLKLHADEMVTLLSDSELYSFIPQDPPELEKLRKTYELWSKRVSPAGDELWLNWIARLKSTREAVGHFQAGLKDGKDSNIAYTVGLKFQRKGIAAEALRAILSFIEAEFRIESIKAWIDTRNVASINLVEKLGMVKVDLIKNADRFKGADSDEFIYQLTDFN